MDGLRQAYFGLFHAKMSYGLIVWGRAPKSIDIFIMQKRAVRTLKGVSDREHCKPYFIELRIPTLYSLYILQCLLYIKNNMHKVNLRSVVHSYATRSRYNIDLPQNRLFKSDTGTIVSASSLYNKLPSEVREMPVLMFKKTVVNFLLDRAFYSIAEFSDKKWTIKDFIVQ